MDTTASSRGRTRSSLQAVVGRCSPALLGLVFAMSPQLGHGASWEVTPTLSVAEIYTDNVELASEGSEEQEFVTEIRPGISVVGTGRRLRLSADYRMQNLFYVEDSDRNSTNHQFRGQANSELVKELFFLDASATVRQVLITPEDGVRLDNIATGNRTDAQTYSISPYLRSRFGGYAQGLARYRRTAVRVDEGASDSDTDTVEASLRSGPKFTRFVWSLAYQSQQQDRETATDFDRTTARADARYRLTDSWSLLGLAGYEDQELRTSRQFEEGTYWAVGLGWRPNRHIGVDALYGDEFRSASVNWNPTTRTSLSVSWRDREVGLNPGEVWTASGSVRTRRTSWQLSYQETTETFQTLLPAGQVFVYVDPLTGDVFPDPGPGLVEVPLFDTFELTDEVFERKIGRASVGVQTGKTSLLFSIFDERREFLSRLDEERNYGARASWNWRVGALTSTIATASWRHREGRAGQTEDDFWHIEAGLDRQIGRDWTASLRYRHAELDSERAGRGYEENRVTARLNMRF